jgi:hypothetical protein
MLIKLPKTVSVICLECNTELETHWSEFGAIEPCFNCDAAPIYLIKKSKNDG